MSKQETAVADFMNGYRCSQAVLAAFAPDYNMDPDLARTISIGLAGGSGVGGECGAVSGAYLVIGLKYGFAHPGDPERFQKVMGKVKTFVQAFQALHGKINCPELIGLDLFSAEGYKQFVEKNIKADFCKGYVANTINILERILSD